MYITYNNYIILLRSVSLLYKKKNLIIKKYKYINDEFKLCKNN